MKRPPLIFRLMLCSLFLPVMFLYGFACHMMLTEVTQAGAIDWTNLNWRDMISFATMSLPFVLWLWMLRSGNWRRSVLTTVVVFGAVFLLGVMGFLDAPPTPPGQRIIELNEFYGADVFCNGVYLGQVPLKIRVDELIAKVPEWDTPPEQRWYDDSDLERRLVTWFPWDNFRKERFETAKELFVTNSKQLINDTPKAIQARRAAWLNHDAGCRYWWSFRRGDTQLAFKREGVSPDLYRSFDNQSTYYNILPKPFSPSVGFHIQLLVDVLPELTPQQKTDWDRHVLTHWSLLALSLKWALQQAATRHQQDKNEVLAELYETALHSTARMKYNLSDPPTEEECRRLLADWVSLESTDRDRHRRFSFWFQWTGEKDDFSNGLPMVSEDVLIPADIREPMRRPLVEQWRKNKYRWENGWAPVAYFSWQDKSPDYFTDLACFSATTDRARIALLENEAPEVAALFKTLLHRRDFSEYLIRQIDRYPALIRNYSNVTNPLVEAEFRKFILEALTDPKHTAESRNEVERAVASVIFIVPIGKKLTRRTMPLGWHRCLYRHRPKTVY